MRRGTLVGLVVGVVVGAAVSGTVAYATIPNSNTHVISGCYAKTNGVLRVIDTQAGATCPSTTKPLSWNQTGPQGPPGVQGPPGTPGTSVNRVTTILPSASVPTYFDLDTNPAATSFVATVTINVTGTGPQLVQVSWNAPQAPFPGGTVTTPCGPFDTGTGGLGQFNLTHADGTSVGGGVEVVPGPGSYSYEVEWMARGCADPVLTNGVLTSLTTGPIGLSAVQL